MLQPARSAARGGAARVAERTGPLRKLRSLVALVVVTLATGAVLAGMVAALVFLVVEAVQRALG
jgi:hypothetical protein